MLKSINVIQAFAESSNINIVVWRQGLGSSVKSNLTFWEIRLFAVLKSVI